jgi:hypothetical protein
VLLWPLLTQIQVLRPVHWLHPRAVMLTALYESLTSDPAIRGHVPPRLRDLLEFHRTLIRYTDGPAASAGTTHAHEQARTLPTASCLCMRTPQPM